MSIEERIKQIVDLNRGKNISIILEKYWFQRNGETVPSGEPWAESEAQAERYRQSHAWSNDGKPTWIASDEEFYDIQRVIYKKVIMEVSAT